MNQLLLQVIPKSETILIDGAPISTGFHIDYFDLASSARENGDYFILTCGCGDAGCAGLFEPIKVTHTSDTIAWHITEPEPKRDYIFRKPEYVAEVRRALEDAIKINPTLPEDEKLGPYGLYQEDLENLLNLLK
jgi:hypothetical protein